MPDFINSYTFVSHAVRPDRRPPARHLGLGAVWEPDG